MKTITLYDLLGLVKDGKAPKKIKYMGYIFEYDTNHKRYESYSDEQIWTLNDFVNVDDNLNDTVKIPYYEEEEKEIPEKMKEIENGDFLEIPSNHDIMNKINEVIDYLVYLKSKGDE